MQVSALVSSEEWATNYVLDRTQRRITTTAGLNKVEVISHLQVRTDTTFVILCGHTDCDPLGALEFMDEDRLSC